VVPAQETAPTCNNLENIGAWVRATVHPGTDLLGGPPGSLIDGIYRATALDGYRGAGALEVRDTVAVTNGGTEMLWTREKFDLGTGATTTLVGNAINYFETNFDVDCGSVAFAPFTVWFEGPTTFVVETIPPGNGEPVYEETFSPTDCAPGD
jgi:hypothetical protein